MCGVADEAVDGAGVCCGDDEGEGGVNVAWGEGACESVGVSWEVWREVGTYGVNDGSAA